MVTDPELFDEHVMRLCSRAAGKVQRITRNYCDFNDVLSEMYMWVIKNQKWVEEYREQGQHGFNKMSVALYRAGTQYVAKERARRTGAQPGDFFYYTPAVVEELLPDVWYYSTWSQSSTLDPDVPRGKSKPSETGNRQAMMIDVAYAVSTLPQDDQRLLRLRFADGGLTAGEIGKHLELTDAAVRRRIERVLVKLCERLGGEPPFWRPGRKSRSNAAAQSEQRRQDGE